MTLKVYEIKNIYQTLSSLFKRPFDGKTHHLTLRWSPGALENSKKVSLSYKNTKKQMQAQYR